jgi:hypothetical protein
MRPFRNLRKRSGGVGNSIAKVVDVATDDTNVARHQYHHDHRRHHLSLFKDQPTDVRPKLRKHGGQHQITSRNGGAGGTGPTLLQILIGRREPTNQQPSPHTSRIQRPPQQQRPRNRFGSLERHTSTPRQNEDGVHVPAILTPSDTSAKSSTSGGDRLSKQLSNVYSMKESSHDGGNSDKNYICRTKTTATTMGQRLKERHDSDANDSRSNDDLRLEDDVCDGRRGQRQQMEYCQESRNEGEYDNDRRTELSAMPRPLRVVEREYYYDPARDETQGHVVSCENWSSTSSLSSASRSFHHNNKNDDKYRDKGSHINGTRRGQQQISIAERSSVPHRSEHSESTAVAHNTDDEGRSSIIRPSTMIRPGRTYGKVTSKGTPPRVRKLKFDPLTGQLETVAVQNDPIPEDESVDYSIPSATRSVDSFRFSSPSDQNHMTRMLPRKKTFVQHRVAKIEEKNLQFRMGRTPSNTTSSLQSVPTTKGLHKVDQRQPPPIPNVSSSPSATVSSENRSIQPEVHEISSTNSAESSSASRAKSVSSTSGGTSLGKSVSSNSAKSLEQGSKMNKGSELNPQAHSAHEDDKDGTTASVTTVPVYGSLFQEIDLSSVSSILQMIPSISSVGGSGRSSISSWRKNERRVNDPPGQIGIPIVPVHPDGTRRCAAWKPEASHVIVETVDTDSSKSFRGGSKSLDRGGQVIIRTPWSQSSSSSKTELGIPSIAGPALKPHQDPNTAFNDSDSSSIGLNSFSPESCVSRASFTSHNTRNTAVSRGTRGTTTQIRKQSSKNPVLVSNEGQADRVVPLVPVNSSMREDSSSALKNLLEEEDHLSEPVHPRKVHVRKTSPQEKIEKQVKQIFFPDVRKVNSDPEVFQSRPTLLQKQLRHRSSKLGFKYTSEVVKEGQASAPLDSENVSYPAVQKVDSHNSDMVSSRKSRASTKLHSIPEEHRGDRKERVINVTGQIGNPRTELLNDHSTMTTLSESKAAAAATIEVHPPACRDGKKMTSLSRVSINDGNSICDTIQSCSRDETRDNEDDQVLPSDNDHDYFEEDDDDDDDDDDDVDNDDAAAMSLNDNISLNNYIPWRVKAQELLQRRRNKGSSPPPLFFKTLSTDDCSTAATKTPDDRNDKSSGGKSNKQSRRRQQKQQRGSVDLADEVQSKANNDEDSSTASTPQSSTLSQVTIDPSLLDNYSFVQFERNFCMDLAAANVGGDNNSTKYDQQVMQRYQQMKERREQQQQQEQLKFRESQLVDGGDNSETQKHIKCVTKTAKWHRIDFGGGNMPTDGAGGGTTPALDQTWSVEGLVESVSKLWS